MLTKAERMIKHYCFKVSYYYSDHQMTANIHQLLHLPQVVLNYGPLNCYSCFSFEGFNGHLLQFIKGAQCVEAQIVEAICKVQTLPLIAQTKLVPGTEPSVVYDQFTSTVSVPDAALPIGSCYALGVVERKQSDAPGSIDEYNKQ